MFSTTYRKCLATAMVVVALAIALPVSSVFAHPTVAPPPSSIAVSAQDEYQSLRAAAQQPTVAEPSDPSGFDFPSAAIGAAVAAGLAIVLAAGLGLRRTAGGRAASA
jgi:ABC-type nitrate/sulfonate/bicarbonate transport system permease component